MKPINIAAVFLLSAFSFVTVVPDACLILLDGTDE